MNFSDPAGVTALHVLIVIALSVVQSVFGIGLLLLGTPVLLLLGLSFEQALWTLLPASVSVSALQILLDGCPHRHDILAFAYWAVPPLILGLLVALSASLNLKIDVVIGTLLITGGILRLSVRVRRAVLDLLCNHDRGALAGIGLVHGLTNMGGGLLSLYASVRHSVKFDIRQQIALGYMTFATAQLLLLAYVTRVSGARLVNAALMASAAGITFVIIGRPAFRQISSARYNLHFSVFEIGCGTVLIVRRVLAFTALV